MIFFEYRFVYYGFSFHEGIISISQCLIDFFYLGFGLGASSYGNNLIKGILSARCNHLLSVGNPEDLLPTVVDPLFFELVTNGVYQPIGQQPQVNVSNGRIIVFVVDWAKVQLCFQASET
ncbi:MAG: hypothetical protein EA359_02820, partial [Balneolaceae bacterium]